MKVCEAVETINIHAPYSLAYEWDNSGFIAGRKDTEIKKILISLDFTPEVLGEAIENGCNLIITHHPYIFKGISKITDETSVGDTLLKLIENKISLICAHTNLDRADGGINDILCDKIGLKNISHIGQIIQNTGEFRVGEWDGTLNRLVSSVKSVLGSTVRISISNDKDVKKVGVCSGSGCEFTECAKQNGCDVFLTADAKYHDFQRAAELGIILIDAGHFETENIICTHIADMFKNTETLISKVHSGFYKTI